MISGGCGGGVVRVCGSKVVFGVGYVVYGFIVG